MESLEEKKKYIIDNILKKGYNKDKFMLFLSIKNGDSIVNLHNLKMEIIINACNEFIQNNIKIKNENNILKEEKYMNCNLIEETLISKQKKVEIKISEPQIEKGGLFSFSYSTYLIKTSPLNIKVRRRYSDFIWLYNILNAQFPNCIIPPFFKKKERLDKIKMNNKIIYMEYFLNDIANNPLLRNSRIFYDFISIENDKDFNNIKYKYEKIESPSNNIKLLKALNGEINISISNEKEKYLQNIKVKLNSEEKIFDKQINNYKILINNIHQTSEKIKEISNIWEELYNKKNGHFESECTLVSYSSLIKAMQEFAEFQNNYCILIKNYIIKFFKYFNQEFNSFKNFVLVIDNYKNYYHKTQQKLSLTKNTFLKREQSINNIQNETKEIKEKERKKEFERTKLLLEDSEKAIEFENLYGCYLNSYINEYERIRDIHNKKLKANSYQFVKELSIQISDFNFRLGEILGLINSLNEEEYKGSNINNDIYNNAVPVAGDIIL